LGFLVFGLGMASGQLLWRSNAWKIRLVTGKGVLTEPPEVVTHFGVNYHWLISQIKLNFSLFTRFTNYHVVTWRKFARESVEKRLSNVKCKCLWQIVVIFSSSTKRKTNKKNKLQVENIFRSGSVLNLSDLFDVGYNWLLLNIRRSLKYHLQRFKL